MFKVAESENEISRCFDVMSELRPHIKQADFIPLVKLMQADNYQLAFIEEAGDVVCVAGYRVSINLAWGKYLYVDDLVTARSVRSKGYGEAMLQNLQSIARDNNCQLFHLDSGTHRKQAHKFYFKQGMTISSFHFDMPV